MYLIRVSMCIYLVVNHVGYLYTICLFAIHSSFFGEISVHVVYPFSNWIVWFCSVNWIGIKMCCSSKNSSKSLEKAQYRVEQDTIRNVYNQSKAHILCYIWEFLQMSKKNAGNSFVKWTETWNLNRQFTKGQYLPNGQ